jgi:peptidoglycan hydrolase-like protein with peptidoglycan-binding domain
VAKRGKRPVTWGIRALGITAVLALAATACGGGGDDGGVGEDGPDTSASSTTDVATATAPTTATTSTVNAAPTTTDDVRREWTNAAVSVWQQFLADRGAVVDIDGFFGPQTEVATLAFQSEFGIPETGVADRLTLDTAGPAVRDAVFDEMTIITTTTTTVRTPQAGDPTISITCPGNETETETQYRAAFDHTESYSSFGNITIEYGDGKDFESRLESSGLTGAFWHVYDTPGTFDVTVVITDGDGISATATCTHTWAP